MSKTEIQSWIATSGGPDEDDEVPTEFHWSSLHEDWPEFVDYAVGQLLTSSTKTRIEFLEKRLSPLAARGGTQHVHAHRYVFRLFGLIEFKPCEVADLFRLLTLTYPRYVDSASREAVERVLQAYVTRDVPQEGAELGKNKVALMILDWLANESGRIGKRGPAGYLSSSIIGTRAHRVYFTAAPLLLRINLCC